MRELNLTADELIEKCIGIEEVCILDSCGVYHKGSEFLIVGLSPIEKIEVSSHDPCEILDLLDKYASDPNYFNIFTLSYDFGLKLENLSSEHHTHEPDLFLAAFDVLIVHNYRSQKTYFLGNEKKFDEIERILESHLIGLRDTNLVQPHSILSNYTRDEYCQKVELIKELIRKGDTYQTNLTRRVDLTWAFPPDSGAIFKRLRKRNPAPFSAFIRRKRDTIISASPERFFRVELGEITTSPIKGTRPRGSNRIEDQKLRTDLQTSEKDLAENVMIVDLLRNDLGKVCEFGSVSVEKLCDLEEHPSYFNLVSTISGKLVKNTKLSDLIKATFPCGSITGCPKISTMKIIDSIERTSRGLSMGAIGFASALDFLGTNDSYFDLSVAIRTLRIEGRKGETNVGGAIVIDSDPTLEFEETVVKTKALFDALMLDM